MGKARRACENAAKALEEKKAIAHNFKNKDIDLNIITDATGLTIEEIESLSPRVEDHIGFKSKRQPYSAYRVFVA